MPLIRLGNSPLGGSQLPKQLTVSVPPLKFGTTRLGTSTRKLRGTIQLGRYVLGGGGFVPPDPRNAYIFWSTGTSVTILPEVNGFVEQFTSKLNNEPAPKTKLGLSFTLGYGGIVSYLGQSDSPSFDGTIDVAFDGNKLTNLVGTGWFQFILTPALTGTTPSGSVPKIDIRVPAYEYVSGSNRLAPPGLYYSPFNARHLTDGLSPYTINLNRLTMSGIMASWTWHVPVVAQYAKINVIDIVASQTALSSFSSTLTGTTPSGTVTFRQSGMSQSLFSYHIVPAIYLISGSILQADMNMDGATNVSIIGEFVVESGVLMDGSTNFDITARQYFAANLTMDGVSDVVVAETNTIFAGELFIDAGVSTDVQITPLRIVNVFLNMDGSADVFLQIAQTQFGEIVFDQINQELNALGSYIFNDGSIHPTANVNATFNSKHIPLGPDYIWGIIEKATGYGSPDFVPLSLSSFTTFGKTGVNLVGPNQLGYHKHKYAFGFSRPTAAFYDKRTQDFTREEWVRFNFFVDSAVDFSQISSSTGFTSSGISGIAGSGLVGRDIEKYVTFSILTHGIMTQTNYEAISSGDPSARITQSNYEMLWLPDSNVFTTQAVGEVLYLANLAAIQQVAAEAIAGSLDAQRYGVVNQVAVEMMHTIKASGLITQASVEGIQGEADPNVNITAASFEVLTYAQQFFNATAVIQQVAVEQMAIGDPNAIINSVAIEEMNNSAPTARINSEAIESIHNSDRNGLVQQIAVEEINNGQGNGLVQQIAIEMLVRPEFDPTVAGLVNNPKFHT